MPNLPSTHFTPLSLETAFNARREELPAPLRLANTAIYGYGPQVFQGIPFEFGRAEKNNVLLLDRETIRVEVADMQAAFLVFVHQAEEYPVPEGGRLTDGRPTGNDLGQRVADYILEYADGTEVCTPIVRRIAIQQGRVRWGASPFEAVTALKPRVFRSVGELQALGLPLTHPWGLGETRHRSGRDDAEEHLWLYALPNPAPDKPIRRIVCTPRQERSVIYAISGTQLKAHPLQPGLRQKLRLTLPDGAGLNALGEPDEIELDLGTVIAAYGALEYDEAQWASAERNVQPRRSSRNVIVEYAAHPAAKLYLGTGSARTVYDLAQADKAQIVPINPANRPVRLRIVDKATGQPVPARLHLHGQAGEYLPPQGYHRKVNPEWFEDNYAEFVNGLNQYSYVSGECVAQLPLGQVYVEITRGYEVRPVRQSVLVAPETDLLTFELERALDWRRAGWVTADTHVHFLSPQTALLEGAAEGVNVVNLLASQWGEMFSNVGDFDGRSTIGAKELGGDGEFLVRVGTENRTQVLGHISLLGYSGPMIHPLCTGGPSESAIGDAQEMLLADWAQECIRQNGLVVMPHAPDPQGEQPADIMLGLIHAIEMVTFNPFDAQINPLGLADWYRYLNLGKHLPLVAGSDKMAATMLLGGVRTYAHLGDRPLTYDNWKDAVQRGHTFVTVGPLVRFTVEGQPAGSVVRLPTGGGTVSVDWQVESVSCPAETVEIVVGGLGVEQVSLPGSAQLGGRAMSFSGQAEVPITESTWIAVRVRGSYRGQPSDIAAHTSAVQIVVEGSRLFSAPDAIAVLEQIEGVLTYVDRLAARPDAVRFKQMRATLLAAHNALHRDLHEGGVPHHHSPQHDQYHTRRAA